MMIQKAIRLFWILRQEDCLSKYKFPGTPGRIKKGIGKEARWSI
jgi:hypothetical protein